MICSEGSRVPPWRPLFLPFILSSSIPVGMASTLVNSPRPYLYITRIDTPCDTPCDTPATHYACCFNIDDSQRRTIVASASLPTADRLNRVVRREGDRLRLKHQWRSTTELPGIKCIYKRWIGRPAIKSARRCQHASQLQDAIMSSHATHMR